MNLKPQCSGQFFLALLIIAGFFGVLYVLLTEHIQAQGNEPLLILFGTLTAGFTAIIGFYFGSSVQPSKDAPKTDNSEVVKPKDA